MKTPIDWFVEATTRQQSENDYFELIDKANDMFKEAIIEAHGDKQKTKSNPDSIVTYGYTYTGKNYYNDKYEK
jgi:hypothetical protein